MEIFNKESVYDNEISPLIAKVIEICKREGIPMLASFVYENCEVNGIGCCTTLINNIENRACDALGKAARVIRSGGHQTTAFTITSSSPDL